MLKPTEGSEFGGSSLPAGWESCPWSTPEGCAPGTGGTVSGGSLHLDEAYARTAATYGAGRAIEFRATFTGQIRQHVGFGVDLNNNANWAIFSVPNDGLFRARTSGPATAETLLPASLLGSPHTYRIEWDAAEVRYYVDGGLVATHAASFGATQMRPIASDLNAAGPELSVDWLRMSPYPGSGTFTSRVFDGGPAVDWGALDWTAATPPGTGVALSVRTGDTPTPDGSWSAFTPVAASGGDIPGTSRYVQYQAVLSSEQPGAHAGPERGLDRLRLSPRLDPAHDHRARPGAGRHRRRSRRERRGPVQRADEPGDDQRLQRALRKQGAGVDVPATVSYAGDTATLNPDADLDFNSVYTVTVAGTVADPAGNQLGADDTWTFTTTPPGFGFTDTTRSDFGAGTLDANTYISQTDNGEVILKPAEGQEFSGGPGLPAGWSSTPWTGRHLDRLRWRAAGGGRPGQHGRELRPGPLARVRGDVRRRRRSSTRASRTAPHSTPSGDVQHQQRAPASCRPARASAAT